MIHRQMITSKCAHFQRFFPVSISLLIIGFRCRRLSHAICKADKEGKTSLPVYVDITDQASYMQKKDLIFRRLSATGQARQTETMFILTRNRLT